MERAESPQLPLWIIILQPPLLLKLHSLLSFIFDVAYGSGMVHLSSLVGSQPQFGGPTDLESTLPNLVGSVTLAQSLLGVLLTGTCCL